MAVAEEQDIVVKAPQARDHLVGAGANCRCRLTPRATVAKQIPTRALSTDVVGAPTLVITVIPLVQLRIDLGFVAEAGQFAGSARSS